MKDNIKIIISIILIMISGIAFNNLCNYNQEQIEISTLSGFDDLQEQNSDFIGWISIPNTNIDYPILNDSLGTNYYLKHDFYRNDNSHGSLFTEKDISLDSKVVNIYGHNMKDGTMFSDLTNFLDFDFFNLNEFVTISTLYENKIYQVIAVFKDYVHAKDDTSFKFYNYVGYPAEDEFKRFKEFLEAKSINSRNLELLSIEDNIVQLITCSYHIKNGRLIIVLKEE